MKITKKRLAWDRITKADEERFMAKVSKLVSGCWLWNSGIQYNGYGQFWWGRTTQLAHRFAYVMNGGYIRPGMTLDHLCRNKWCVNPEHLEQVTSAENTFRCPIAPAAINHSKKHCTRGHEFSRENTARTREGYRVCRICQRTASRNWKLRQRSK